MKTASNIIEIVKKALSLSAHDPFQVPQLKLCPTQAYLNTFAYKCLDFPVSYKKTSP